VTSVDETRARLLAAIPLEERRVLISGVSTALLEGGDGPPLVLLHGPGEFAATWLPVLPQLAQTYRVIAPDLPGHGASRTDGSGLGGAAVLGWLDELIELTCPESPVLVGRVVGGAIAARFAIEHPGRLARLVLVDSGGFTEFEPEPRFGLALHRFLAQPTEDSYSRFMDLCAFDLDRARDQLGPSWEPFAAYAVALAREPDMQAAIANLMGQFMAAPIPSTELDRIEVPTTLIWGRHDLATPLRVAEAVATRTGWPLHVIEDAGDDPALDQPAAFLLAVGAGSRSTATGAAV
jgi:pimeloyl-ACP methyl ester carboxylesterase